VIKHRRDPEDLTEEEIDAGYNSTIDFFRRISTLKSLGLLEITSHLVDQEDDGEILHELTAVLDSAARNAAESLLSDHHDTDYQFMVPVERHFKEVTIVTTYRTIYKPRTSLTGGWYQEAAKRNTLHLAKYNRILGASSTQLR